MRTTYDETDDILVVHLSEKAIAKCKSPDDRLSHRSYPLLAARELIAQFVQEQRDGYQTA